MGDILHMSYASSISELCEVNSSFDTGVLRIAYTGANRNGSYISKDTFERCIKTLYNCPIVCRYDRESDSIGGHDMEAVKGKDGSLRIVNMTIPVGVIPESSNYFWSIAEDEDGTEHEYLCADVLIWKRQEAYKKIKEDGITAQSMEIHVNDGEMEDGLYVIKDFEFTAFCLLGDEHEPCFEGAALNMYTYSADMKAMTARMLADLQDTISGFANESKDNSVYANYHLTEGGEKVLDKKIELITEYGLTIDDLDFAIDDLTFEELREKLDGIKREDGGSNGASEEHEKEFALVSQVTDEIIRALDEEKINTEYGEIRRYFYTDHDQEAMMVYCYDWEDWKLYGFSYSMNGDSVVIDFGSKKRMKISIVEYDEGDQVLPIACVFEKISGHCAEIDKQWSEKYQSASGTIDSMTEEIEGLRKFKADADKAAKEYAIEQVLEKFDDLSGIEEFETLRANCSGYETDSLEEKCFAIRGRNLAFAKAPVAQNHGKMKIDKTKIEETEPYGGLFVKYGHDN